MHAVKRCNFQIYDKYRLSKVLHLDCFHQISEIPCIYYCLPTKTYSGSKILVTYHWSLITFW